MDLTREQKIERGKEARRFLESPVFADVLRECEAEFVMRWKESDNEKDQRAAWVSVHALAVIERMLRGIANDGLVEETKLNRQSN